MEFCQVVNGLLKYNLSILLTNDMAVRDNRLFTFNKVNKMKRINEKDLQNMVDNINELLIDKVHLSGAYGGWKIERDSSHSDVLNCGFVSKPRLYEVLSVYYRGLRERS